MLFLLILFMLLFMVGGVVVAMIMSHRELRPKQTKKVDVNEFTHFV